MTNYGYMIFTFRAHKHGEANNPLPLGQLSQPGGAPSLPAGHDDALVVLYGLLHWLKGRRIDERNRHLGIASVCPGGRCVQFSLDLGTSGQSSVFVDPEGEDDGPVFTRADRHIETNPRRGLLVVPTDSTVGLLVLESRSRSTGRDQLAAALKRGFRAHTGLIIDFDAVVHEAALASFLAQAHVNAITLKRHSLHHDIAEQLEVRQPDEHLGRMELTISRGRIGEFKRQLADKFRRDSQARSRLLSVGGLDFEELNVKMQVGERKTTLSVSADKVPSFVYHLSSTTEPSDQDFYNEVLRMVPEVASAVGVIVGAGWQTGAWSAEHLDVALETPVREGVEDDGLGETPSKFSSLALVFDHYDTFRDVNSGKARLTDYVVYVGIPLGLAFLIWLRGVRAGHIPEVLAAVAILTGLIFNVFVLLFDLTMRATDRTDPAHEAVINKLADEVRANVSYAVLLGPILTVTFGGLAMFTDTSNLLHPLATAAVVFLGVQLLLTISMILKRIRALYRAFRTTGGERIP